MKFVILAAQEGFVARVSIAKADYNHDNNVDNTFWTQITSSTFLLLVIRLYNVSQGRSTFMARGEEVTLEWEIFGLALCSLHLC